MFPDLKSHPEYFHGDYKERQDYMAKQTGKNEYTWQHEYEGLSPDEILTNELKPMMKGKVLDVGCGHGEYTNRWSEYAEEVVGYDMTAGYIETANKHKKSNVRYVVGRTHEGLPFQDNYFDLVYTKKGPTSWFKEGNRIVRPGGRIIMLYVGDQPSGEMAEYFPGWFNPPVEGTPLLDTINKRLEESGLVDIQLRRIEKTIWFPSPEDIVAMMSFGQNEKFHQYVRETFLPQIQKRFDKYASEKGLKSTELYYLIHACSSSTE